MRNCAKLNSQISKDTVHRAFENTQVRKIEQSMEKNSRYRIFVAFYVWFF